MNQQSKPSVKKLLRIRVTGNNSLRIAETLPGRSLEIEDEDGSINKLIHDMDGTRTPEELWNGLRLQYPHVRLDDVVSCIKELDGLALLDDQAALEITSLSAGELERFKANLNYFSSFSSMNDSPWQMQSRLKEAKITMIGLGTLGSGVLFNLAGCGVTSVRVVDFDYVELSNLNRQMLYNEHDIGRKKI